MLYTIRMTVAETDSTMSTTKNQIQLRFCLTGSVVDIDNPRSHALRGNGSSPLCGANRTHRRYTFFTSDRFNVCGSITRRRAANYRSHAERGTESSPSIQSILKVRFNLPGARKPSSDGVVSRSNLVMPW